VSSSVIDCVIATGNPHKLVELRALLADQPLRLLAPSDLPEDRRFEGAEETGTTFQANADLKAAHAARVSGMYAIADDSGLEIDALGGHPGVRSARYAGVDGDRSDVDRANNAKLIGEAREAGLHEPLARFRCVVSVARPDGTILCRGDGSCEGVLIEEARGGGGFGYDPHFLVPSLGKTFAEVTSAEKNSMSHRSRALSDLRTHLVDALREEASR
jgi:XTP/dITP diphosphohydrolase